MPLLEGRRSQPDQLLSIRACLYVSWACMLAGVMGNAPRALRATVVFNPAQLQEAVRSGAEHIVINDHIDMRATPRFSEATSLDSGMVAIVANAQAGYTKTIMVCVTALSGISCWSTFRMRQEVNLPCSIYIHG